MKELLILRHAKSSWDDEGIEPDLVLTSTAERAATTAAAVVEAAGLDLEPLPLAELYLAEPAGYLDAVRRLGEDASRVMIVGHNPGLGLLASRFAGHAVRYPTATLARVRLALDEWERLDMATDGELIDLWRPKELPG